MFPFSVSADPPSARCFILQNIRDIEAPPDPELLDDVLALLRPQHNTTWPQGRPENHNI